MQVFHLRTIRRVVSDISGLEPHATERWYRIKVQLIWWYIWIKISFNKLYGWMKYGFGDENKRSIDIHLEHAACYSRNLINKYKYGCKFSSSYHQKTSK
jgi:hypothetical protein